MVALLYFIVYFGGLLGGHLHWWTGYIVVYHVCFGGCLAGCLSIEPITSCSGGCLHWWTGHVVVYHVCFGGHLACHCACASSGEILHILPKLATMSALGSWHVYCLGWVIWWSDRNRQDLLTECTFMSLNKCVFM